MIYRVLDPSRNVNAADLPEITNNRNMKSMKISCQVTAAISLLEIFGNVFGAVIWLFIAKYVGNETLLLALTLYFILLPYTFLMNTHHNRNLVVEDGWAMVIKNFYGGCSIIKFFRESQVQNVSLRSTDQSELLEKKIELENSLLTEHDIRYRWYIISRHHDFSNTDNGNAEVLTLNVPIRENEDALKHRKCPTSKSVTRSMIKNQYLISLRSYVVHKMLVNMNDETCYMNLFKIFVELEHNVENLGNISPIIQKLDNVENFDKNESENDEQKGTMLCVQPISNVIGLKNDESLNPESSLKEIDYNHIQFICNFEKRIEMRKILLKILFKYNKFDNTMYKKFVNDFIKMESSLVK